MENKENPGSGEKGVCIKDRQNMTRGNLVSAGDLTLCEDPHPPILTMDLTPIEKAILIEFETEEDVRAAMDAGCCSFSLFSGLKGEGGERE